MSHEGIRIQSKEDVVRERAQERPLPRIAVTPEKVRVLLTEGKGVEIDWSDGHRSAWGFAWLRDACPCATCIEERSQQGRKAGQPKPKPAELLPMFHVLQALNDSNTAAQEEINGLVNQVQQTLTDDQIKTIDNMSLSMQDVLALTQSSSGSTSSSKTSSTSSTNGGAVGGPPDMGDMPGGDPGGMPVGAIPSTGTTSASSGTNTTPVMDTSTPSALFDTVIELLQKKVQ